MSATLSIISNLSMPSQGVTITGKQGASTDAATTAFTVSVTGTAKDLVGSLATASVATVYNSSNDAPSTFDFGYYWADQDSYIQLITSGTSAVFKVLAETPFWLPGYGKVLGAATNTAIAGNSEPVPAAIASIVIGNYSGTTMNYRFIAID